MSLEPGIGGTHDLLQICEDLQLKCTAAVLNHLCYLATGHLHLYNSNIKITQCHWNPELVALTSEKQPDVGHSAKFKLP